MGSLQYLTRAYRPERWPAPLGRGPCGWPLARCPHCGHPIPWHPNGRTPESPCRYYARIFCGTPCARAWRTDHPRDPIPRPRSPVPLNLERAQVAAAAVIGRHRWAGRFPLMVAIRACPRGHTALREITVGKSCLLCGAIIYARDGDWAAESLRVRA